MAAAKVLIINITFILSFQLFFLLNFILNVYILCIFGLNKPHCLTKNNLQINKPADKQKITSLV